MRILTFGSLIALVWLTCSVCQAQTRELSLRLVEIPPATTQPAQTAGHELPLIPANAKVLREIRLAIECGHRFEVSAIIGEERWELSGVVHATQQAAVQFYRIAVNMELKASRGVESFTANPLVQHGNDTVASGLLGGAGSRLWVLRVSDPPKEEISK